MPGMMHDQTAMTTIASVGAAICVGLFVTRGAGLVPRWVARRALLGVFAFALLGAGWVFPFLPVMFIGWVMLGRNCSSGAKARERYQVSRKWEPMTDQGAQRPCCGDPMPHTHRRRPYDAAAPSTPHRRRPYDPPAPETPATRAESGLLDFAADTRLPAASRERVGALHDRLVEASKYVDDRGLTSGLQGFGLEQIRDDFAPSAIRSFLALPPSTAQTTVLVDGKTGADLLNDQLDLLIKGVDQQLVAAAMASGDQMVAGQRFLQEKFGQRPESLDL